MLTTMENKNSTGMERRSWTEFLGVAEQSSHPWKQSGERAKGKNEEQ